MVMVMIRVRNGLRVGGEVKIRISVLVGLGLG